MITLKMKQKAAHVTLVLAVCSGMAFAASNTFADAGMYVGAAYGESRVNDSDFNGNHPAAKIFLGGKFNPYIGIEGAMNEYGKTSNAGYSSDLKGNTLALMGYLPLSDAFELFIKGGRLWWHDDVTVLNTFDGSMTGNEYFYGVGGNFNFTKTISLRVEMERYNVKLDKGKIGVGVDGSSYVDVASVGILFNF
jgi:hypothetical protein